MPALLSQIVMSLVASAGSPAPATPSEPSPTARKQGVAVVELFTSEGCSSCPPADRVLGRIASEIGPADNVYLLAWHVDYWDRLGWKDPFGLPEASRRQREYERVMSKRGEPGAGVYTPQTIVNGTRASVGSDDAAVRARIARAVNTPATCTVSIAPLAPAQSGTVSVTAEISGNSLDAEAVAVVVEDGLVSSVKSGENAGETLRHARVVRAVQTLATPGKQPHFTLKLPVDLKPANARVVVFLQRTGLGEITAAASAPLAVPSPVAPAPAPAQ